MANRRTGGVAEINIQDDSYKYWWFHIEQHSIKGFRVESSNNRIRYSGNGFASSNINVSFNWSWKNQTRYLDFKKMMYTLNLSPSV